MPAVNGHLRATGFRPNGPPHPDEKAPGDLGEHLDRLRVPRVASGCDNGWLLPHVYDQGQLGACVLFGVGQAFEASMRRQGLAHPYLPSPLAAYRWARGYQDEATRDQGTTIATAIRAYDHYGFAPDALYPYRPEGMSDEEWTSWLLGTDHGDGFDGVFVEEPPPAFYRAAYDQRAGASTVHRVLGGGTDGERLAVIQRSLAAGCLIAAGWPVSGAFCRGDVAPLTPLAPPKESEVDGQHCMVILDWRVVAGRPAFRVRNSWGPDFADHGTFLMSPDYVLAATDHTSVEHVPATDPEFTHA